MGTDLFPAEIRESYEVHEWKHACAILRHDFPAEWQDVVDSLTEFRFRRSWISVGGGRKSKVAAALDKLLINRGWVERKFNTEILVDGRRAESPTHSVDCFKNGIALEIEWNNKDPFYDRDLNNFRLLFDLRAVAVGVIVTHCDNLQGIFDGLGRGASYGTSTTHMSKLLPRIEGGGGGCPMFAGRRFATILADPPWQFQNRTGKMAPEHKRLARYSTLKLDEIAKLPVEALATKTAHLYLWVPNASLLEGLKVMDAWGFTYKTNLVWHKVRKDGGPDGRGVGFYFRNVTELVLFGVRGKNARTLAPGRRQVNMIKTQKREHSRKPDELYAVIEACSPGPFLELFARGPRRNWSNWGNEAADYFPSWPTYANHSQSPAQGQLIR